MGKPTRQTIRRPRLTTLCGLTNVKGNLFYLRQFVRRVFPHWDPGAKPPIKLYPLLITLGHRVYGNGNPVPAADHNGCKNDLSNILLPKKFKCFLIG